jgi:hypothetical protein
MMLPTQYIDYFAGNGPREGGLTVELGWFQLWSPGEIEGLNRNYRVHEFAPGFLDFGSSGGGELLAFDSAGRVVVIPFVGMAVDAARRVAESWIEFLEKIEN